MSGPSDSEDRPASEPEHAGEAKRSGAPLADDAFRRVFEDAPIGMAVVSLDGRILNANHALIDLTGFSREELLFMEPGELAHEDDSGLNAQKMREALEGDGDRYRLEKQWVNALGHMVWVVVSASLVRDDQRRPLYFIWHVEDGSMRKREQGRLQHLADHDPLTELANSRHFQEMLGRQVSRCKRYGEEAAVLVLDLDRFKEVNDTHGHAAGDEVLREAARVLSERARDSDVVARLGGDEFGVLLLNVSETYATQVADDIRDRLGQLEVQIDGTAVSVSASVGVTILNSSTDDADALVAAADAAMYDEKRTPPPPTTRRFSR